MNNQDIGFVISIVPYREYDAMMLFLGKESGLLRFVLRGHFRKNTKRGPLGLEFSKIKIQFDYKENRLNSIYNGELLNAYLDKREDYDWIMHMNLISELLQKTYQKSFHYEWVNFLETYITNINWKLLCIFLSKLIIAEGFMPEVDYCVLTQNKKVSDFSIEHGGFVAKEYRLENSKIDLNMLKAIRMLFKTLDINQELFLQIDGWRLCDLLIQYLEYHMNLKINSWKLIYVV